MITLKLPPPLVSTLGLALLVSAVWRRPGAEDQRQRMWIKWVFENDTLCLMSTSKGLHVGVMFFVFVLCTLLVSLWTGSLEALPRKGRQGEIEWTSTNWQVAYLHIFQTWYVLHLKKKTLTAKEKLVNIIYRGRRREWHFNWQIMMACKHHYNSLHFSRAYFFFWEMIQTKCQHGLGLNPCIPADI